MGDNMDCIGNRYVANREVGDLYRNLYKKILLLIVYFVPIFTFFEGTLSIIAVVVVALSIAILYFEDDFFLILPILIFFYSQLVLPGGLVVFRIYSFLFLLKMLMSRSVRIEKRLIVPFLIITFYCITVVAFFNFRMSISVIFDMLFVLLFICYCLGQRTRFIEFFKFYSIAAISSIIYGFLGLGSQMETVVLVDRASVHVTRFLATYEDPNYIGFFFNIAIFSIISMGIFNNKKIRLCILFILYMSLLATLSITAMLCNILGLLIYIVLKKDKYFKHSVLVVCIFLFMISIYHLGNTRNVYILADVNYRIQSKISELSDNNLSEFTSNRTNLWASNANIFWNQPVGKMLFGGNYLTSYEFDKSMFSDLSHQEFIDMSLNFGILGTLILMSSYIFSSIKSLRMYVINKSEEYLLITMIKYVWFFYAFGLSMFPSWRFYLFFFI